MSTQDVDDRREYYRIDDTIALDFTQLSGVSALDTDVLHDPSPLFNLLSDLHLLDFEAQHLLRQISERDRTLSNYLKVMNKRIDLLGQALAQNLLHDVGAPRQVSMSESGISFNNAQELALDAHLAIKMVLMPQGLGLLLRGKVVNCRLRDDNQYEIGVEFEALTDAQRQLMARHILQRQALERRQLREQV
jgi:hypothetical protein